MAIDVAQGKMNVLPITHAAPMPGRPALALDPMIAKSAGLDDGQNYLVLDENNLFSRPTKLQRGNLGQLRGAIVEEILKLYLESMAVAMRRTRPHAPR
jgi:hypothetical protein